MARPRLQAACVLAAIALAACGQRPIVHPGAREAAALEGAIDPSSGVVRPSVAAGWRPIPAPPDYRRGSEGDVSPTPTLFFVPSEPLLVLGSGGDLADILHRMVGSRPDHATSAAFALAALTALGLALDPGLAATEEPRALRALARERGALDPGGRAVPAPHLGDLLLLDRTTEDGSDLLIAVVVGRDARGVIEFIYLGRGVVRRGYLSRAHPADKRDADGRILNTFLRHAAGDLPAGTPALAGQLDAGTVRLDRLLR